MRDKAHGIIFMRFHLAKLTWKSSKDDSDAVLGAFLRRTVLPVTMSCCILFFRRNRDTLAHMTTPKEMLSNVVQALRYLDSRLPNGSHVILTGLVDGRFLWDNLHDRYHPLGKHKVSWGSSCFSAHLRCFLSRRNL